MGMSFADEIRRSVKKLENPKITSLDLQNLEGEIINTLFESVKNKFRAVTAKGYVKNNKILCCLDLQGIIDEQTKPNVHLTYYDGSPFSYCITSISRDSLSRILDGLFVKCEIEGIKLDKENRTRYQTLRKKKKDFIEGKGKLCMFFFSIIV